MSTYYFYNNLNQEQKDLMDKFLKSEILYNVSILKDDEPEGYISKAKIPYILRSFLQFPSQFQIVDEVIPSIEKIEVSEQKDKNTCVTEYVCQHIINILKENTYPSYGTNILLQAFSKLDTENNGYLDLHTMFYMLKNFGICFSKDNIKEMEDFCIKNENDLLGNFPDNNFDKLELINNKDNKKINENIKISNLKNNQYISKKFYYQNYVRKVENDNREKFKLLKAKFNLFCQKNN